MPYRPAECLAGTIRRCTQQIQPFTDAEEPDRNIPDPKLQDQDFRSREWGLPVHC